MLSPLHKAMKKQGRYGDTEVRNIDGSPAHVNKTEAHWIDKYVPLGVLATKKAGSGTTNPKTGMKEYSWLPLIGAGVSLLGSMFSKKPKFESVSNKQLGGHYAQFQDNLDRQNDLSEQLIDPNSSLNLGRQRQLEKSSYEQQAFGNMLNQRNFAQGGMGGFSGIQSQQRQAGMDRAQQQGLDRMGNMMANNFGTGFQGIQQVGKGYQSMGDTMAQHQINQTAAQNQLAAAGSQSQMQGLMGLGQGIMNWGLYNG